MKRVAMGVAAVILTGAAAAQESSSYKLTEHVFNAGGHPAGGAVPASASYRMTLHAVGDPVVATGSSGGSYRLDAGFVAAYFPPDEVRALEFSDTRTLRWNPERSAGEYRVFRNSLSALSDGGPGFCAWRDLSGETGEDEDDPPPGDGFLYLVAALNRLGEEGGLGTDSRGFERRVADACP